MNVLLAASISRAFLLAGLASLCAILGGCFDEDHYNHRDLVSDVAGDAIAVNAATQTINPWPKEAKNPNIEVDGKRLGIAVQRYQDNKSIPPRGLNTTTTVSEQAGPGSQVDTAIQK
ncbi:MAG: hypothetical protein WBX25_12015 [Rhodomicrobium sp.]